MGCRNNFCSLSYDTVVYPGDIGIVFGNEALGVSEQVLHRCESLIEIPVYGYKNSLNVAAACAVIGYKVIAQQEK